MSEGIVMKIPEIFSDNMILQRRKKICVFGNGSGNGYVEICGKKSAFTCKNNCFCAFIPPLEAGGPYELTIKIDKEVTVIHNVLIGDVYVAAGQSNMELKLNETVDIEIEENDNIRYFNEPHSFGQDKTPLYTNNGWQLSTGDTPKSFSAVAYAFAKKVYAETKIPIGIVSCNKGASRIDAWTDPKIVSSELYQDFIKVHHPDLDLYGFNQDGILYNNKLLNIVPFTNSGILWYQGESNRYYDEGKHYDKMLELMISNWRNLWNDDLPFYCVQLMPYVDRDAKADWAIIREKQVEATKKIKNTYLITLENSGNNEFIHPKYKNKIGVKLANAVLKTQFSKEMEYTGPIYDKVEFGKSSITITFTHADGLSLRGEKADDIYVIDQNDNKHEINAKIEDSKLLLKWESDVNAKYVIMGYSNCPKHNLYNSAGYLASPFKIRYK